MAMEKITVFLASSIGELRMDRLALSELTGELNDILIDEGERIQLFMCEHYDTAIALHGKQNEYNEFIQKPCDLFINLYHTKAGEYTIEEFDVALATRQRFGKPAMYVFWKETESISTPLSDFLKRARQTPGVQTANYHSTNELLELFQDAIQTHRSKGE